MVNEIAVTEFKAHCLRLLEAVSRTGAELIITKRGRPFARVSAARKPRSLKGTVKFHARLEALFSTGAKWEQG